MRRVLLLVPILCAAAACLAAGTKLDEKVSAEPAPQVNPELVKRLEPFKAALRSADPEERQAAYHAYLDAGDEGRRLLREALLPLRTQLVERCGAFALSEDAQKRLRKAHELMSAARAEALRIIFDRNIYPDANHGRAGQPVVDQAVNAVKTLHKPYKDLYGPVMRRLLTVLRMHERIVEFDAQLELCSVEGVELKPSLEALVPKVPADLLAILAERAKFWDYCFRCERYNQRVKTSMSSGERRVVELTNEYRIQLGIKPLAINEPLTQAARKHSAEMAAMGYFGHSSPKPERRSPGQRCALEGYRHFGGENCASGAGADGAFRMWYHSSGHHRNMIGPGSNEIGVGFAGPWTEDFGGRPELDLDRPPRSWGGEPAQPEPAEPKPTRKPKKKTPFPWDEFFRH